MKRLVTGAAVVAVVIAAPVAASASWKATGSASGTGHTANLLPPTVPAVSCTNGNGVANNGKVQFAIGSWTANGTTPASYNVYVDNSTGTPGATGVTTTSWSSAFFVATHSHTYSIQMTDKLGRWESAKSTAHTITIDRNGNCGAVS